jgi:serine/threonine protein kinase
MGEYMDLPNYSGWELIHEDHRAGIAIHRAHVVNHPQKRVVIKSLQLYSAEQNQSLRNEYDILKHINKNLEEFYIKEFPRTTGRRKSSIKVLSLPIHEKAEGFSFNSNPSLPPKQLPLIPNVIALERMYDEGFNAIIFEEFDGVPLRKYYPSLVSNNSLENMMDQSLHSISSIDHSKDSVQIEQVDPDLRKLDFEEILNVMILLTEAIEICHRAKVAHLDINPGNILIQKSRNKIQLQLNNFHNSVKFEDLTNSPSKQLRSYTYASPEQTGRTERLIDYRSDMYSLGITFWELLVEDVPFKNSDATVIIDLSRK